MNEDQIKKLIQEELRKEGGRVPNHVHNGIDSPLLSSLALGSGSWSLVATANYTGDTTISGLSGDTDKIYMLVFKAYNVSNTMNVGLRFNGDSTNTYKFFHSTGYIEGGGGSLIVFSSDTSEDNIQLNNFSQNYMFCTVFIDAVQGGLRFVNYIMTGYEDNSNFEHVSGGGIYNDGSAEMTSMTIHHPGGINPQQGTYWLYKGI